MIKKIIFVTLISIFIVMFLGSCERTTEAPDEIVIMTMFGKNTYTWNEYNKILDSFREKYPEVNFVDYSETSSEKWKESMVTNFKQNKEPDILFYFVGEQASYMTENNLVVSVDEIRNFYPNYASNISYVANNYMQDESGIQYAVPIRGFWEGMYINKDMFDKYDLPVPNTWERLSQAFYVFHSNGVTPIAASLGEVPHYWIENTILSVGGIDSHEINISPTTGTPRSWLDSLDVIKNLYINGAFPENTLTMTNSEAIEMFKNKEAAILVDGSWVVEELTDYENIMVLDFPSYTNGLKKEGEVIGGFTSGFYITNRAWTDAEKRNIVVELVSELTSDESIYNFSKHSYAPAADIDIVLDNNPLGVSSYNLFNKINNVCSPIDSSMKPEAWSYLTNNFTAYLKDEITAESLLTNTAELNK